MNNEKNISHVTIGGETYEYPDGTILADIASDFQKKVSHDILICRENGYERELHHHIHGDAEIEFITTADRSGHRVYQRSCSMLLVAALNEVVGKENVRHVVNHFSVGDGFYYTVDIDRELNEELVSEIEKRMRDLVSRKLPIQKKSVHTHRALAYFEKTGQVERVKLFKTRLSSRIHLYTINDYDDYYYGLMAMNTGYLKYFKLYLADGGLVLQMPNESEPEKVGDLLIREKLLKTKIEGERESAYLGIPTIGALNETVISGNTREMILTSEALQETRLSELAQNIADRKSIKFVMVAGPSSSGKTTFSQRLCIQLMSRGLKPHYVGLDNYYKNWEDCPVRADGSKDFECLESIDVEGFNKDMTALLKGERVEMPSYDFIKGKRVYRGDFIKLEENDLLVIEGLHGLNEKMSASLPSESKYRVYISALTQLNIDDHNRIPTSDGRLIRRIIRDNRTRGTNAASTIKMWPSVRRGEEENMFPFQEGADFIFNSALPYEFAVLKQYAQPLLFRVPVEDEAYPEAQRLLKFMDYFIGLPEADVPSNSILREFIGNGCFHL